MSASQILRAEAAKRILIKDGAYGTSIQNKKLQSADYCGGLDLLKDQRGNNDLLNITRPEVVRSICESFADAGAEILATNTFNANAISQADYGAEAFVRQINRASAEIMRGVANSYSAKDGGPRWVAGALGPTNKTLSLSPDVNDPGFREVDFDQVKAVYREQVDALVEGRVDFILVETVFDTIKETLERGEKIKISGFGNFVVRDKNARVGRNPQTGEEITISARRVLTFKPSQVLKTALNT